ncbi:hypothetical protein FRB91_002382 [Serendipita sp. 411]|nr:hypothetical protein FRC15_002430 [Serendipita sp. 397]KAG8799136.1 hypothetical protein FRC16_005715 [Serendipita sp. 398]KAG8828636.1 hypothetical protein FRC19_000023 [Serendipita sp. 401]KAG8832205.1 hypothetical protein FRC18_005415 [Serendipita sp. 400]KAG8844700.1 hypothetical protein FRB91_002382 [Serendipita sp. 411]KAG9058913.1 hypothetical protein FS842_000111 [Serendipita sp. 407]
MAIWDPILLISQIVAMQSLHYLTLAILLPPAISIFASKSAVAFHGGPANVNFIMSWHPFSGKSPIPPDVEIDGIYSGGVRLATSAIINPHELKNFSCRWIIAAAWLVASLADVYYLYTFIRKPRLILDFALTLLFNHVILTTYYSASFPTSIFFWITLTLSAIIIILLAEQLCVRRELSQDFRPVTAEDFDEEHSEPADDLDEVELTSLSR